MTTVYLESSALLAWMFGEPPADEVRSKVDEAENVVTSVLTLVEVERALIRAESRRLLTAGQVERLRGLVARISRSWTFMEISSEVRARASRPFEAEPLRTLDAIHLSTALVFTRSFPDLYLLSFDQRILRNATALGIGS